MAGSRVLVVGAGIVGSMTAMQLALSGDRVTLIDGRAGRLSKASNRNLGAVRVSGRMPGVELESVLRSRDRWESVAQRIPGIGFKPTGSLTLLSSDAEVEAARSYVEAMGSSLKLSIVGPETIKRLEPGVVGNFSAGMVSADDAWITPDLAVQAIIEYLQNEEVIDVRFSTDLVGIDQRSTGVVGYTADGAIPADQIIIAPGARWNSSLFGFEMEDLGFVRVHYHATEVDSPAGLRTLVTDISSFDIYPGFAAFSGARFDTAASGWSDTDWVASPSAPGRVRIGIARTDSEHLDPSTRQWLADRTRNALGIDISTSLMFSAPVIDFDRSATAHLFGAFPIIPGVTVVTGLGQYGNTLAPLVAWEIADDLRRTGEIAKRLPGDATSRMGRRTTMGEPEASTDQAWIDDVKRRDPLADFVRGLSHEIRSPLTVVRGAILEIAERADLDADSRALLDDAQEAVELLTAVAYDLFTVTTGDTTSQGGIVRSEEVDLVTEVEQVVALHTDRAQVLDLQPAKALGDPYLVRQVIRGLIRLAESMRDRVTLGTGSDNGTVWVEARAESSPDSPASKDRRTTATAHDYRATSIRAQAMQGSLKVIRTRAAVPGIDSGNLRIRCTLIAWSEPALEPTP